MYFCDFNLADGSWYPSGSCVVRLFSYMYHLAIGLSIDDYNLAILHRRCRIECISSSSLCLVPLYLVVLMRGELSRINSFCFELRGSRLDVFGCICVFSDI